MGYEKLNEKMMELKDEIFASLKESNCDRERQGRRPEEDAPYGRGPKEALDHALALGRSLDLRLATWTIKWMDEYGDGEEMAAVWVTLISFHLEKAGNTRAWMRDPRRTDVRTGCPG